MKYFNMENVIISVTYQNKNLSCSMTIDQILDLKSAGVSAGSFCSRIIS